MDEFLHYLVRKPAKVFILLTFIYGIINLKPKHKKVHLYIVAILLISLLTESLNTVLYFRDQSLSLNTTISLTISMSLWLLILQLNIHYKSVFKALFFAFWGFALANVLFFEGTKTFNNYTFIIGSFIYITIFLYESFYQLKRENFEYFFSNIYILIFAPVILFFGLTSYFAFKDSIIGDKIIVWKYTLYDVIVNFINLVHYGLICIYIYREKNLKNAR